MATRDAREFDAGGRVDHFYWEDGTLVVYDPQHSDAWIECRTPVHLSGRN